MNRTKLKNYAPQARKDFIEAVTAKAEDYGLTKSKIEPTTQSGDVVIIAGKPFPKAIAAKRKRLEERIKKFGFEQTMEAVAYTCFNRLIALRYMELHGYLEHGFRVLSSSTGDDQPEILQKAQHIDLPGLDQQVVTSLKLDGNRNEELYRLILTAQFNALSKSMPFLFERVDDETELLLPDKLLHTDSLIRKLVTEIDEDDWQEVEIIGWLYQFYISEKKDEVIGKVVKSEDIPAATQLFTPNWIVKYLVQNTIGRQWLATYPQSSLRSKMEYYIEPAEQTPEVQEQLRAITPTSLNPEDLTLLDPACGSGHILVEAYDLFKAIYEERGYRSRDIPALILQKNLFGLEIDDRAAQLAAFALMMKARADYSRVFELGIQPNIVAFVESKDLDAEEIHYALMSPLSSEKKTSELQPPDGYLFETENNLFTYAAEKASKTSVTESLPPIFKEDIESLVDLFEHAKTFGSLIQVPQKLAEKLPLIVSRLAEVSQKGDLLMHKPAVSMKPLVSQALLLARQYDAVVANPPYMGGSNFNYILKELVKRNYSNCLANLYACFIKRNLQFIVKSGSIGMINLSTWMFLEDYKLLRNEVFESSSVHSFLHNGRGVWGSDFDSCAFTLIAHMKNWLGVFKRLYDREFNVQSNEELQNNFFDQNSYPNYKATATDFVAIPGSPIAFWLSKASFAIFKRMGSLSELADPKVGLQTGDNPRFLRLWYEVDWSRISFEGPSSAKWYPYAKGGEFRKWFGNALHVINWQNDGYEVRNCRNDTGRLKSRPQNSQFYFREAIEWSDVGQSIIGARYRPKNYHYDVVAMSSFYKPGSPASLSHIQCFLNSAVAARFMNVIAPGMHYNTGYVGKLPLSESVLDKTDENIGTEATEIARLDWNSHEIAWEFKTLPMFYNNQSDLSHAMEATDSERKLRFARMKELEEQNNRLFIEAYGLQDELSPDVPDDQITLYRADRTEDIKRLISYIIGCTMGRYSLDKPGLIYAHSGNEGFDPNQYRTFRADDDGIIPLLDSDWGIDDDATSKVREFVGIAWDKNHLDENLKFIAESLETNSDNALETIRKYLSTGFYKHHLSMYKKRPIYWLFSSGKQRAFQCLVYLHRYNEGTLSRIRTEYVLPVMGKMNSRLEFLQGPPDQKGSGGEIAATSAVTVRRKLEKERDTLKKQIAEIQSFDEKLRHYADLRIKLDLDDGVKVNYGKFSDPEVGDILAEVKSICGTKDED